MAWTKQRLGELLGGQALGPAPVDPALGAASVTTVSCSGEVAPRTTPSQHLILITLHL